MDLTLSVLALKSKYCWQQSNNTYFCELSKLCNTLDTANRKNT